MAISQASLRAAALEQREVIAKSLTEAKLRNVRTAFLCHSHLDRSLAKGLQALLLKSGWRVYIDWEDASMPETPNRETAARIQSKIAQLDYFVFLATANSTASRWCPWEIGYADGTKLHERILIVPTTEAFATHGNEYLQLYSRIDVASTGSLAAWRPGQDRGIFVSDL